MSLSRREKPGSGHLGALLLHGGRSERHETQRSLCASVKRAFVPRASLYRCVVTSDVCRGQRDTRLRFLQQ